MGVGVCTCEYMCVCVCTCVYMCVHVCLCVRRHVRSSAHFPRKTLGPCPPTAGFGCSCQFLDSFVFTNTRQPPHGAQPDSEVWEIPDAAPRPHATCPALPFIKTPCGSFSLQLHDPHGTLLT